MLGFIRSQLARHRGRALALAAGILVAATSFTLLTSAVTTSRVETQGSVQRNARATYDILVRPKGGATELERTRGLVRENHLSGIFGGITLGQYREMGRLPGVEVAAPVANLGYLQVTGHLMLDVRPYLTGAAAQLFRFDPTYTTGNGSLRFTDAPQYLYVTRADLARSTNGDAEVETRGGKRYHVCVFFNADPDGAAFDPDAVPPSVSADGPFDPRVRSELQCKSLKGQAGVFDMPVTFPVLLSAIDPAQEDRLVGLSGAVVSGRTLRADDPIKRRPSKIVEFVDLPVLTSSRTFVTGSMRTEIRRLDIDPGEVAGRLGSAQARRYVSGLRGSQVGRVDRDLGSLFPGVGRRAGRGDTGDWDGTNNLWSVGPVQYRAGPGGRLTVEAGGSQDPEAYRTDWGNGGFALNLPVENSGVQTRRLTAHAGENTQVSKALIQVPVPAPVGAYDLNRLRGSSALSRLPLETYRAPEVRGAGPADRAVLGGRPLAPSRNVGGYLAQPPGLLTTLDGADAFLRSRVDKPVNNALRRAPISAIRLRVAGVRGIDEASRARVNAVAYAIRTRFPKLEVDLTVGASPVPQTVQLPSGVAAQQPVHVVEAWVKKGVGLRILAAVDRKSALLFGLILVVCGLFLGQAALASVRARRSEIGTLRTLGWGRREIFQVVLGELLVIGAMAGAVGAALAYGLGRALDLRLSLPQTLLVLPVAVLLAVVAGALPAWRATRIGPLEAIAPPVVSARRTRPVRSVAGLAVVNLRRMRGRTLLGAAGLALGVAAFTVLLAVQLAFRGEVAGSLLGDAVVARVRMVDLLSVALSLLLGAAGAVDVLVLSLRERSGELAALRASGWSARELVRLGLYEGTGLGLLGGFAGALTGIGVIALLGEGLLGGRLAALAGAGLLATLAAVVLVLAALVIPMGRLSRLAPAGVLAEE